VPDAIFPARKLEDAHRVDEELILVLKHLAREDEPITARAVIRRMQTAQQTSTLTRDAWRMGRIREAESVRIKRLAAQPVSCSVGLNGASRAFRSFRYFVALARLGNFGRAARELHISQSALTKHIRSFEEDLGTLLLIRHSRGVTLTRAGLRLLEVLDVLIPMLNFSLSEDVDFVADSRTLRLGVPSECASLIIPAAVDDFCQFWPNVRLDIREATSPDVEDALLRRRVDVAILQDPHSIDELGLQPILDEELGLVCAPSVGTVDEWRPLRIRDLAHVPLILPSQRHCIRRRLDSLCLQRNIKLTPRFEIDSLRLRKELVRRWNAATILPYVAAKVELDRGALTFRPIDERRLILRHAISFSRTPAVPFVTRAVDILGKSICGLVERGVWPGAKITRLQSHDRFPSTS
jgi:DNA-binding transcriptional LysR family regulator